MLAIWRNKNLNGRGTRKSYRDNQRNEEPIFGEKSKRNLR